MADPDEKMVEAIAFFENMLQTMPEDRTSLEFLSVAYEQTGQQDKHRECLIRLADCLLHEKDFDNAQSIALRLSAFSDYAPARAAVERVTEGAQSHILQEIAQPIAKGGALLQDATGLPVSGAFQDTGLEIHALSRAASAIEMEMVWFWKERELLPKEVCMDILHILTDSQVTESPILISALALLDEQHPELTDRLMEEMQRISEVPVIPLELFDVPRAALDTLSSTFIHVRGTLPFAVLGGEVLVAVLNPMSQSLQEEVTSRVGKPCHFFLTHPRIWQEAAKKA